ncbi:MAG: hypothetical protein RMJ56_05105 [Gemmataceae bacterium]|nr:hypothetical protein [Gemmata sp.]MDW8196969.1 hypothetical protein [Gemmataceae bacterium]
MSQAEQALGVITKLVADNGRWVVYLGIDWWTTAAEGHPVETIWHRIADFPTIEAAMVAARYYQRGADRVLLRSPTWPGEFHRETAD